MLSAGPNDTSSQWWLGINWGREDIIFFDSSGVLQATLDVGYVWMNSS